MALPSFATRPPPARRTVALTTWKPSPPFRRCSAAGLLARVKAMLAERSDNRVGQLVAGKVFLVRVASALLALVSQVLLARWMGFEFGIYIYVWTWVLMIGACPTSACLGGAPFHPRIYRDQGRRRLRGFFRLRAGSPSPSPPSSASVGALGVTPLAPWLDSFTVIPLYLACVTIPIYGVVQVQAGIAQAYDWPNLA